MHDTGAAPSPGDSRSGVHFFQNGVWLTRGRVDRVDKYSKWAEDHVKSEVQRLDKEEHDSMVKLNGQCLQVLTELRDLKKERRLIHQRRHNTPDSLDAPAGGEASATTTTSSTTTSTVTSTSSTVTSTSSKVSACKGLPKSSSWGSLTSLYSSGYSSLSSSNSGGRRSGGEAERGGEAGLGGRSKAGSPLQRNLTPDASISRLKNIHSARALSKLNNKMQVYG